MNKPSAGAWQGQWQSRAATLLGHTVGKWKANNLGFIHSFQATCLVVINHQIRIWNRIVNSAPATVVKCCVVLIASPSPVAVSNLSKKQNLNQNIR